MEARIKPRAWQNAMVPFCFGVRWNRAERSGRMVPSIAAVMPYTKIARLAARIEHQHSGITDAGARNQGAGAACGRMKAFGPWRSLASAPAWGAGGPGFKSRRPDQTFQTFTIFNVLATVRLESNWSPN